MAPPPYPTSIPSPSPTPTPPPKASVGPVPTDIPVLPIGTIKLATIPLRAYKPTRTTSVFSLDLKATTIIGGDSVAFALSSEPAKLYLNSPIPPSPSPRPSSKTSPSVAPSPTPTPPPGTCLSSVLTIAYASRAGACAPDQAQSANYICSDNYAGLLGDNTTCTPVSTFEAQAKSRCGSPHSCVNPPVSSDPPKPSASPTAKPATSCEISCHLRYWNPADREDCLQTCK